MSQDPRSKYPKPGNEERPQQYPGIEEKMHTKPIQGREKYVGSGKLTDKTALVTGGDSGIGRAVAVAFACEGADVIITHHPEETVDADATLEILRETGVTCHAIPVDFVNNDSTKSVIDTVLEENDQIDVLVNNAAKQKYYSSLDEIPAEDLEEIYRINVVAPFLLTQAAVPHMPAGGSIINTTSVQAYDPSFSLLPYAASKGALSELTKALSEHLIEYGIRVNAIAPGPIWSPLNTHGSPEKSLHKFGESTTIGRPGQPAELAPLYVLLASEDGSYLTGEIFGITGGKGIV